MTYPILRLDAPARYRIRIQGDLGGVRLPGLEGLTLKRGEQSTGLRARDKTVDVVIRRNRFLGFHYSIQLSPHSRYFHITDNVISGDNDPVTGGIGGEGIELFRQPLGIRESAEANVGAGFLQKLGERVQEVWGGKIGTKPERGDTISVFDALDLF